MSNHRFTIYESPIGPLTLTGDGVALTGLWFPGRGPAHDEADHRPKDFAAAIDQLEGYFAGDRRDFGLPLSPRGTPFQHRVWAALLTIPYGQTSSYGALAQDLADDADGAWVSPRAVGAANGANPISIIVPCHRVISSDGSLTGYGGGLQRKRALLDLETRETVGALPAGWEHRQIALL
ncbi:MAG: methylated-DNA--[protein]-cysteine S-methyltransferase [Solirubrobacteraceae bacterium]